MSKNWLYMLKLFEILTDHREKFEIMEVYKVLKLRNFSDDRLFET